MLEYLSYKKIKDLRAKKAIAENERVLEPQDEKFLDGLVDDEPKEIPLAANPVTLEAAAAAQHQAAGEGSSAAATTTEATAASIELPKSPEPEVKQQQQQQPHDWKGDLVERAKSVSKLPAYFQSKLDEREKEKKEKEEKKKADAAEKERLKEEKKKSKGKEKDKSASASEDEELTAEEKELQECLEKLNMAAAGGTAFSLSTETKKLLREFTQILKDLANGVPTAYNDLTQLFEKSSKQIDSLFENIPGFLKKVITSVGSAAPPGEKEGEKEGSMVDLAAKTSAFALPALKDLANRAAIKKYLASILAFLRTRFPALMGTNAIMSMALFVLLFVFYYCYKRGKEVRLEKEKAEAEKLKNAVEDGTQTEASELLAAEPEDATLASPVSATAMSEADDSNYTLGNATTQTGTGESTGGIGGSSSGDGMLRITSEEESQSSSSVYNRLPINRPAPPEPAIGLKELAH